MNDKVVIIMMIMKIASYVLFSGGGDSLVRVRVECVLRKIRAVE